MSVGVCEGAVVWVGAAVTVSSVSGGECGFVSVVGAMRQAAISASLTSEVWEVYLTAAYLLLTIKVALQT